MYPPTAMDLFPAGGFVRLRAPFYDTYVYADHDAVGVSRWPLIGGAPAINAVWMVEHCFVEGDAAPYIMIQSAAYGRYLAVSNQRVGAQLGFRVVQRDDDSPNLDPRFVWRPYRVQGGYVVLSNPWDLNLRAYAVTLPHDFCACPWIAMADRSIDCGLHWEVEAIPPSPEPLPLPPPAPPLLELIALLDPDVGFDPSPRGRRIRYALANDEGVVNQELTERPNFFYEGRSVFDLRTRVENDCNIVGITLCVLAGKNARPIPLVADLPMNQDPMDIIVYTNGSPAAAELRFPTVGLPEP